MQSNPRNKPIHYAVLLICIAFWGPLYRAILDKLWIINGDLVSIGHWAQLQTLIELIGSPIAAGIAIGLSISTTQQRESEHSHILISSYCVSLLTVLPILLFTIYFAQEVCLWLGLDLSLQTEIILCAIAGYLGIASILMGNLMIGRNQQGKAFLLLSLTSLPIILTLGLCCFYNLANPINWVLYSMIGIGLCINVWLIQFVIKDCQTYPFSLRKLRASSYKLAHFIPAGLSIGILSPLCTLLVRSMIAQEQNWVVASEATALWRVSDWILSSAVSILYFHYLPLLSGSALQGKLKESIQKIALQVMLPSTIALILLIIFHNPILHLLYSDLLEIPFSIALLFWSGDAVRILSAIFLLGLFVLHSTKLIAVLDIFSQPLFVLLLFLGMASSLQGTGIAYLVTYCLYATLCIYGFYYFDKKINAN